MGRFRHFISDEQWQQFVDLAESLHVPPRELFNVCSAIGLQFLKLGLNPPRELLEKVSPIVDQSPVVQRAADEALKPLKKYSKRKASKKKSLVR